MTDTPLGAILCQCANCQQRTGSAFSLSMLTYRRDFEISSGDTLWRDLAGGSGALHRQHICPECFTRTHTEMPTRLDIIDVRPGTLDDPSIATPIAQVWTRVAHPRAIVPDVRRYDEDPADVEALVEAWRDHAAI